MSYTLNIRVSGRSAKLIPGRTPRVAFALRRRAILCLAIVSSLVMTTLPHATAQPPETKIQISGKAASEYLTQTSDGQSLRQAVTAARFGLRWQKHAPGDDKSRGGYLGISHNQNLNAWFGEEGVTLRPTLPEEKRDQAWSAVFRLKACGYGKQLVDVAPIVSRQVKGNRIEYVRQNERTVADYSYGKSQIENRKLIEWYENRAEGIEQGFTINERPPRSDSVEPSEPLRVALVVTGDLQARTRNEQTIELLDASGQARLSYGRLVALDADGKEQAARMETSADGRQILLVVEDAKARYPIVIDPIVASLEKTLDAGGNHQAGAEFGDAVAIAGDLAVVGAWREDLSSTVDVGAVYLFSRSGSVWSSKGYLQGGTSANGQCGHSVAISGTRIVFGCSKANNTGRAFIYDLSSGKSAELSPPANSLDAGDQYGASVAIRGNDVFVGAPSYHRQGAGGLVRYFGFNSNLNLLTNWGLTGAANEQFGASLAIDGSTLIVGAPGSASGKGKGVAIRFLEEGYPSADLLASDGAAGDFFGQNVAISGNTVVVGAGFNDEKAKDAGAAYVFVRDANGQWSQQQKLTASDARAGDLFGYGNPAVAIQGNLIVVGALFQDNSGGNFNQDGGATYIFTRNLTTWTQQTRLGPDAFSGAPGDLFGDSVSVSGNSVVVGAQHARANDGTPNTGAAHVYRLDCVPPSTASVVFGESLQTSATACPGNPVSFFGLRTQGKSTSGQRDTVQWRKNGVNIPGATDTDYIIDHVISSDAGSYDSVVSNSCGGEISSPATLSVQTYTLNPTAQNITANGSTGIVNVTCTGSCSWAAVSNSPFITINSGSSGTGNGTVGFTVASNPNSGQRIGTMTIAGLTFTVSQDGINCTYSIAPTSKTLNASASTNTVNVTAVAGCAWTATSNDPSFLSVNSGATGSGNGTVTYAVAANSGTAPRTGTLTVAGQTFTVTQGTATGLAGNVSTRLPVGTDDNVLIEGFIVQGPAGSTKKIIIRAIGPSLLPFGITDALANPTLVIKNESNAVIATNDDWRTTQIGGIITADQSQEIATSGATPTNDNESAIIANLAPGNYTATVAGVGRTVGTGVVDAYDLSAASPARLANVATRGVIAPDDKLMIAGFIIQNGPVRAVVRAVGPSLTGFGVNNALQDTTLQVKTQNGTTVIENDDWESDQKAELELTTLQPSHPKEAAVVVTLQPGQYTAQVRGKPETTGIGVVQVYFLQ
ncbi:MAG: hypothetical protein QOH88_3304 [Verrucomicrobiota bacterium]|jgi:hypothetical protein